MAYNHNYSFNHPYKADGTKTLWKQVVDYVIAKGAASKREILKEVWGLNWDEHTYTTWYRGVAYTDNPLRGRQSSMFAQLNEIQPSGVHYDPSLKKWTTWEYLEKKQNKAAEKIIRNSSYGKSDKVDKTVDAFFNTLNETVNNGVLGKVVPLYNGTPKVEDNPLIELASNYNAEYAMVTLKKVVDGKPTRFKLVCENGNCYFRVYIKLQTANGDWADMYTRSDIDGLESIRYYDNDTNRIAIAKRNIEIMKKFINKVF